MGLSLTIFLVAILGVGAYRYYEGKLSVVSIHAAGRHSLAARADQAQNFVLAGSDTRDFAGGAHFQAAPGSADYVSGQRSDTVLLVHLPPGQARATIVSFPRDSYVQIPAYTDSAHRVHPAHMGKLNEAFGDGGPLLLVQMLEQLTGLRVDHYVQVDFGGFQQMVDAVGGIDVCVRSSRHDKDSGDNLTAGLHPNLNGAQALAFVRDRKGLTYGDIDRIKDQQYFLSQMLKKVLSAGTLTNPFALNRFLTALTSNVTVDSQFGFGQIRTLATRLRHLDPAHVTFTTVPFTTEDAYRTFGGYRQSVVLLDPAGDARLFQALKEDGQPTPARTPAQAPTRTPLVVAPSQIAVHVRNATAISGLAARTADQLRAVGFRIADVASVPATGSTQIRYSPDRAESARTLAAAVPGAVLVRDTAATDRIELVLGAGPVTVRPASVGSLAGRPTAPAAGASALPAATDVTCAP